MDTDKKESRKYRTPFTYQPILGDYAIFAADSTPIAMVKAPDESHVKFMCLACNHFDRLYELLHHCRAAYEDKDLAEDRVYREILQLAADIENERRVK
jgi:hypothetical protein